MTGGGGNDPAPTRNTRVRALLWVDPGPWVDPGLRDRLEFSARLARSCHFGPGDSDTRFPGCRPVE